MKRKLFILSLIPLFLIGCNSKKESEEPKKEEEEDVFNPDVAYDVLPSTYEDTMPSLTKDGNILHCFGWSFNQIKKNLPAIAEAGFKSVQTSPVQQPKSGGSSWWAFYQPLSFSIADNSPLGTKEELKEMCDAAEELGISVICDIVFNHLANIDDKSFEPDGTPMVSPDVAKYEPEIYDLRNDSTNPTFHHVKDLPGAGGETQFYQYGNLPDLNTAHELVQERSLALLKECIDVGVDGFRFDAAKHIETSSDPEYASDFWENTLGEAKTYYRTKYNKDLYAYGEMLGSPAGRPLSYYSDQMDVTDDGYVSNIMSGLQTTNPERMLLAKRKLPQEPDKLVTWVESHDTFCERASVGNSQIPEQRLLKAWAAITAINDGRGLYFARPDSSISVAKIGSYTFENPVVGAANRFHNRFLGASTEIKGSDTTYIVERYSNKDVGALILETTTNKEISIKGLNKFPDGKYIDQVTGSEVQVSKGKANLTVDSSGIAFLCKNETELRPIITLSQRDTSFAGSLDLRVVVKNATQMSYQINGGTAVSFNGSTTITLDQTATITFKASNSSFSIEREYTYKKYDLIPGYFNVVNLRESLFDDYDVYLWSWGGKYENGLWNQDYTVQDGVMLVDTTGITGFLIGLFSKGYTIKVPTLWDSGIIKQSGDIKGDILTSGFYDGGDL